MIPGSWTLVTLQALLNDPRLSKHVVGSEILNMSRGGISSNASCIMSCLRPLTQRNPFSSTDVVPSSSKHVKFWTAVMRGLLAQNEMNESLSSDVVSVLGLGDVTTGSMVWSWQHPGSSSRELFCGHARERHQGRS